MVKSVFQMFFVCVVGVVGCGLRMTPLPTRLQRCCDPASLVNTLYRLTIKSSFIYYCRDLIGVDNLLEPPSSSDLPLARSFIRGGCLQKLSRKGYQQRMFFLFTDFLLYTSRYAMCSCMHSRNSQNHYAFCDIHCS